jgi:hypothetical protein
MKHLSVITIALAVSFAPISGILAACFGTPVFQTTNATVLIIAL